MDLSLGSAEHKPGTNGNIGSGGKQHAKTTGHEIHPNYASILETGVKTKDKRLFLKSLHSFLHKTSVTERAPYPRVYPSLVSSLGNDVFFQIFAFRGLCWTKLSPESEESSSQ